MQQRQQDPQRRSRLSAQRSRQQQERRKRRGVLLFGVVGLLLITAIPAYGYYDTFVAPNREWVVKVNDTTFTMGYLLKLLRMQQAGSEATGQPLNIGSRPYDLVQLLAENEVISQAAPRLGLTVTDEEMDTEIRRRLLGEERLESTEPDAIEREFEERYRFYLNRIQLSEEEHRQIVRYELLTDALLDHLGQEIPIEQPGVRLYSIPILDQGALSAEEVADEIRTQFARGVPFPDLVRQYAPDDIVRKEGEIGWLPPGISPNTDPLIFEELQPCEDPAEWLGCQISEPIGDFDPLTSQFSLNIYLVRESSNLREVEERYLNRLKNRSLEGWLQEEKRINDVRVDFDSYRYAWVIEQLTESTQRR
jgi:hypothetical protein